MICKIKYLYRLFSDLQKRQSEHNLPLFNKFTSEMSQTTETTFMDTKVYKEPQLMQMHYVQFFQFYLASIFHCMGEQGWRNVDSTPFPPMWVEFVVGSLLCSERLFSGYSSPQKPTFINPNSTGNGKKRTTMWMRYLKIIIHSFSYLCLLYLFFCKESFFFSEGRVHFNLLNFQKYGSVYTISFSVT